MRFKSSFILGLGLVSCSLLTNVAQAAPITGTANIAGSVTVTNTSITFGPGLSGVFFPVGLETGSFTGLTGGSILNLTGGPVTGAVNIPGFASFTAPGGPVVFNLTNIVAGNGTVAGCASAGPASCTPLNSPFTLVQNGSNTVLVGLTLLGESYTGSAATGTTPTVAVFSTQIIVPGTIPAVIAALNAGTLQPASYSATFNATPVPEPASMLLLGMGLVGAGLVARRKINS